MNVGCSRQADVMATEIAIEIDLAAGEGDVFSGEY